MKPEDFIPHLQSETKIGIYGGSFNPPHIGHAMAILYAMAMHKLDQVWVLPCGEHAEGKRLLDFGHRYKMCQIAFTRIRNCRVLHLEYHLPKPSFTNLTLRYIRDHEPNANLHFIVGDDVLDGIPQWEGGKDTLTLARPILVPRSGFDNQGHLLPEISSSEIRQQLEQRKSVERHLDAGVRGYIKRNRLYEGEFQPLELSGS